jgi:hypothetical protein
MTKRIWMLGIALVVLGMVMGCSAARQMISGGSSPEVVAESLEAMPADAAAVTRAIGRRLGDYPAPANVRMPDPVDRALRAGNVTAPGFNVQSATLTRYTKTGPLPGSHLAGGRIELQDALGRRTAVAFEANYEVQGALTIVNAVRVSPLFDTRAETVCFVVPAKAAVLNKNNYPKRFTAFYAYMGERAIAPQAVVPGERSDYVMVVFFLNRMSPSANASLAVSDTPAGIQGHTADSRCVDFNGWRVGMLAGCLALKNPASESNIYLKAVYTPGKEAGFLRMAELVGVYALAQRQ